MEVRPRYNEDGSRGDDEYIAGPGETLVLTGPVRGLVTLSDGRSVDLSATYVAVRSPEEEAELFDAIGQIHVANGHPEDIDVLTDPETGESVLVQRPFVHITSSGEEVTGVGTPLGEHPLDDVQTNSKSKES